MGDRWTILILRDAFRGIRRFDDFRRDLEIARPVLADRLRRLVEAGVMVKVAYQDRPRRYEYRLTRMGIELSPALVALMRWGDRWLSDGLPPTVLVHEPCGHDREQYAVRGDADLSSLGILVDRSEIQALRKSLFTRRCRSRHSISCERHCGEHVWCGGFVFPISGGSSGDCELHGHVFPGQTCSECDVGGHFAFGVGFAVARDALFTVEPHACGIDGFGSAECGMGWAT